MEMDLREGRLELGGKGKRAEVGGGREDVLNGKFGSLEVCCQDGRREIVGLCECDVMGWRCIQEVVSSI